jgi:hypothetical protein
MTRYFPLAAAFLGTVFFPSDASAWNSVGHMAVAKLAYDQLDEREQLRLFDILKSHPHFRQFLAASRPDDIDQVQWVLMRSAVWSDWIRPRRKDDRVGVVKYHRGENHYINVPLIAPGSEEFFAGKALVSPDLPNVLTALKSRCNDIRTRTASDEDKAVAICWVFHLIGDIHQPMHNVAYFSKETPFQTGDLGGNKFAVRDGTKKWKLHVYWDDLMGIDRDYNDDSQGHQLELYKSALKVAERLRGVTLTDADKIQLADNTTFDSWSKESFEFAKSVAYMKGDGSGLLKAVEAPFNGAIPDDAEELGEAYIKRARETAAKRIVFAGKRLAERMKVLLKSTEK